MADTPGQPVGDLPPEVPVSPPDSPAATTSVAGENNPTVPIPRVLSVKEQKFIEGKAKGLNNTDAMLEANPELTTRHSAAVAADRMMTNPVVKDALADALKKAVQKHNLTFDRLIKPISEGLDATKTANFQGSVYQSDVPDHAERIKASKAGLQVLGVGRGGNVTFNLMKFEGGQYFEAADEQSND